MRIHWPVVIVLTGIATVLCAQTQISGGSSANAPGVTAAEPDVEYICPMEPEVRSKTPGKCPHCGMAMVANLPESIEYPLTITTLPKAPKPGQSTHLHFRAEDPKTKKQLKDFEIVHEKLYHFFVVSQDLKTFDHIHPVIQPDASFNLDYTFPKAGMYRLLSDFYPKGGTPQLIEKTMMVPGPGFKLEPAKLEADLAPQHAKGAKDDKQTDGNLDVDLELVPPQPIVGEKTMMFFHLKPNDGIEPYIGAMGHMLAVSSDLIDMIHNHPFLVTDPVDRGYKQVQFNLIFPRAGIYRVWIQFQRRGIVDTVAFNIPVEELK